MTKLRIIPKKLPLDNPMDTLIMLRLMGYGSPRAMGNFIDKKIEEVEGNDIVSLSAEYLHWNIVKVFAEDMSYDKARSLIKRFKKNI